MVGVSTPFENKGFFEILLTELTATKNTDVAFVLPSLMQYAYMPGQLGKAADYHVYMPS